MNDDRTLATSSQTATGCKWQFRLSESQKVLAEGIAERKGLDPLLVSIAMGRDVAEDQLDSYLNPRLRNNMPDPEVLLDLENAVERTCKAIQSKERVAVFGDYDVDGATSAALLKKFFRAIGMDLDIFIPDRQRDGYGPNEKVINDLAKKGCRLLITVDCGSTSHEPLAEAVKLGIDTIVLDHHRVDDINPPAVAFVNPNRRDETSGLSTLAAVGVVFFFVVALNRALRRMGYYNGEQAEPEIYTLLDLVALGTVCDVMPITGVNRAMVAQGLKVMERRSNPGLSALMDRASVRFPMDVYQLGFLIGPRINAAGRIGDSSLGTRLLSEENSQHAISMAAELNRLNRERQAMEDLMVSEAMAEAEGQLYEDADRRIICLASHNWHPGIIGLIASRVKERFQKPCFALVWDHQNVGTASGRSVHGIDLGGLVSKAVKKKLLTSGGGHEMAAGLSVTQSAWPKAVEFFEQQLRLIPKEMLKREHHLLDSLISVESATLDMLNTIELGEPYGVGNPKPVFCFANLTLKFVQPIGTGHLRGTLESEAGTRMDFICFRALSTNLGDVLQSIGARKIHVIGRLLKDQWNNRTKVTLQVIDIARL